MRNISTLFRMAFAPAPEPKRDTLFRCPTPQARVNAGAAFLDVVHPGWENKINVDYLDISSGFHCVVGQLYDGYHDGCMTIRRKNGVKVDGEGYGFVAHAYAADFYADYHELTRAWKILIRSRRIDKQEREREAAKAREQARYQLVA